MMVRMEWSIFIEFSTAHFPPIPDWSIVDGKTALGERIIVHGRITDEDGRPVPRTIVEIWQANASGRYRHPADQHDAPIDPALKACERLGSTKSALRFSSRRCPPFVQT